MDEQKRIVIKNFKHGGVKFKKGDAFNLRDASQHLSPAMIFTTGIHKQHGFVLSQHDIFKIKNLSKEA